MALVLSSLDYCNGLPSIQISQLQSVFCAIAQLIHCAHQRGLVTALLQRFQWLSVPECITITLKLWVIKYMYLCLHGTFTSWQLYTCAWCDFLAGLCSAFMTDVVVPTTYKLQQLLELRLLQTDREHSSELKCCWFQILHIRVCMSIRLPMFSSYRLFCLWYTLWHSSLIRLAHFNELETAQLLFMRFIVLQLL